MTSQTREDEPVWWDCLLCDVPETVDPATGICNICGYDHTPDPDEAHDAAQDIQTNQTEEKI